MAPVLEDSPDVADALRQSYQKSLSKQKKNNEDHELLENLKKGDLILKKDDDKIAEANLNRDESGDRVKSASRSRSRRKATGDNLGRVNEGYDSDEKQMDHRVKKKNNLEKEDSLIEKHDVEEGLKPKRKKKKKVINKDATNTESKSPDVDSELDEKEPLVEEQDKNVSEEKLQNEATKAKKKKKRKKKAPEGAQDETDSKRPLVPRINLAEEDERVLGITIHRTDRLKQNKYVTNPVVRVHVMDVETQEYVRKDKSDRELKLPHEAGYEALEQYPPMTTHDFDFKKRQSLIPRWEEQLFVDERYLYFLENIAEMASPNTIVFFEILNYVDVNNMKQSNRSSNWLRIAWAFLKLVGANRSLNVERKVRLQLFYPHKQFTNSDSLNDASDGQDLMSWFISYRRVKYPATIYVTIKGTHVSATQMPSKTIGRLTEAESDHFDETDKDSEMEPSWSRLPGQICKVPNKLFKSLKAGRNGCSVLRFSNDGRRLACACGDRLGGYTISLYDIPSGKTIGHLAGHFNIIYDLSWSKSDLELVSCSQDGSVLCWDVDTMKKEAVKIFTHPSYVYCAKYHPTVSHIIVSGCYDNVIRVWSSNTTTHSGKLLRELIGHNGFVNCLCFNSLGTYMYSCDSVGTVITWRVSIDNVMPTLDTDSNLNSADTVDESRNRTMQSRRRDDLINSNNNEWVQERSFTDPELSGVPISVVQLHGSGRRLLLQCKDNTTRVLDLRLNLILARYAGAINFKDHIRSTFTPCGSYIFSSSEDFTAVVWNTDTCETVCCYEELGFTSPISDICYHPFEHMVAFCAIGSNQPIVIYTHDHKAPEKTYFDGTVVGDYPKSDNEFLSGPEVGITGLMSTATTPRIQSFRAKSPLLSSSAFYGQPNASGISTNVGNNTGRHELMTKSSRELASEIIQHVRLDQVNRQLKTGFAASTSHRDSSLGGTQRSTARRTRLQKKTNGGDVEESMISQRTTDFDQSTDVLSDVPPSSYRSEDLVRTVDREMPGPRMTMLLQSEHPRFMFSAKTGVSHWARSTSDYTAQRSDELTFSKGVLIKIVMKDNDNWWLGEIGTRQGYVPANCLEMVTESDAQSMLLREKEEQSLLLQGVNKKPTDMESHDNSNEIGTSGVTAPMGKSSKDNEGVGSEDATEMKTLNSTSRTKRRQKSKPRKPKAADGEVAETAIDIEKDEVEDIIEEMV